ncbi:MBL fold metallo-hydrolase [Actinomyces slackii]|uniref:Hydroxyacylglutathione hydrolase n=1 Tax=Actinomyces slackii TaxID=52774 RepID=A0A3S4SQF9_9ACTO|nr:MBL fold metallo-hydrolase [Actinomyces slackii]VEG75337.1 hydroxyacylglutathione hydrolase [Actinomyces slackii]
MILERTIAPVFAANCYVLAPGPGSPALVVDPGAGAAAGALALMRGHGLTLGAILLTHGHADHVWDTHRLIEAASAAGMLTGQDPADPAEAAGRVPVHIPEPDLYRLEDPDATTGVRAQGMGFADLAGSPWARPSGIRPFPGHGFSRAVELVPGIGIQAVPAPGHSEGSSVFFLNARLGANDLLIEAEVPELIEADPSAADQERDHLIALSGDVIFKGSVGRTDLPGGDQVQMLGTLRLLASAIDPATVLLPGHGAATTMAHEHRANPYLAEAKVRGGDLKA